ncbi:hypothetical protein DFP73DRAFT_157259 [Morchella snyderi]|nr:hypothetical protein DFP73DRAFT_157259 [Morchella snyderi]
MLRWLGGYYILLVSVPPHNSHTPHQSISSRPPPTHKLRLPLAIHNLFITSIFPQHNFPVFCRSFTHSSSSSGHGLTEKANC